MLYGRRPLGPAVAGLDTCGYTQAGEDQIRKATTHAYPMQREVKVDSG